MFSSKIKSTFFSRCLYRHSHMWNLESLGYDPANCAKPGLGLKGLVALTILLNDFKPLLKNWKIQACFKSSNNQIKLTHVQRNRAQNTIYIVPLEPEVQQLTVETPFWHPGINLPCIDWAVWYPITGAPPIPSHSPQLPKKQVIQSSAFSMKSLQSG